MPHLIYILRIYQLGRINMKMYDWSANILKDSQKLRNWLTDRLTGSRLTDLTGWRIYLITDFFFSFSFDWPTVWLTDWLTDLPTNWPPDWPPNDVSSDSNVPGPRASGAILRAIANLQCVYPLKSLRRLCLIFQKKKACFTSGLLHASNLTLSLSFEILREIMWRNFQLALN